MSNSYFNELRDEHLQKESEKEKEPFIKFLESLFPFTKDFEAPYSETLNYTPADTQQLLEKFESEDNRGLGFRKTVTQEYEDFNGRGPGTLYLSDKDGTAQFTFYPTAPKEWMAEQNRKIVQAGTIANAPMYLAPFAMAAGVKNRGHVPQKLVMEGSKKFPNTKLEIPITSKGMKDAKLLAKNLNQVDGIYNRTSTEIQLIKNFANQQGLSVVDAERYLSHFTPYGILKDTNKSSDEDSVYFTDKELFDMGFSTKTYGNQPMEARFQYQGNFMFGPNGEVHWNKIDPASQVAWQYWLESTAQKSGYASMKEMVKIFREWPEQDFQDFMHELWDGATGDGTRRNRFTYIGYSEHKKAKASKKGNLEEIRRAHPDWTVAQVDTELARVAGSTFDMDWLHDTEWIDHTGTLRTDGIGLGDRNQPKNMLALFDSQWKSLKDISEQVGYGSEAAPGPLFSFSDGTWRNPKQRFYIDVLDPGKQKQYLRQNPGEIVIKRASNHKVVGSLGAYLRALYPMDRRQEENLKWGALRSINPNTGKNFTSLAEFREYIILERINIILNNTATLPSASKTSQTKRNKYITQKLQEDMVDLGEKYKFLKSIPEWTEAAIGEDYDTWRGQSNQAASQGYKSIKNMKNINIGGTKAGGTLKEKGENYIQQKLDEWLGRNDR